MEKKENQTEQAPGNGLGILATVIGFVIGFIVMAAVRGAL